MAGIGERQNFKALGCEHAREPGPSIRREVHDLFAAGAAVEKNKAACAVEFSLRREKSAVHVPVIAVAPVAGGNILSGEISNWIRRRNGEPILPAEFQE